MCIGVSPWSEGTHASAHAACAELATKLKATTIETRVA